MRLYNTLARKVEDFQALELGVVRMYTCGPTVYRYAHIGNLRSYLMADWLRRILEAQGYEVHHVKNITDVGHMRQEMLERGEDKVIAAALAEGKTSQEIADFYTEAFHRDEGRLNILPARWYPRATEHIGDMVDLNWRLQERGYAYEVQGNLYFSVQAFPHYGELSGNRGEALLEGVRAEVDSLKHDPRDFTLWRRAEPDRELKWDSPWGEGFPGWHIECSAMSQRYLGEQLDIHTGGVDNIFPHHEGEIAQSEGAFGKPFVRYWIHGQHLLADGVKMAKSAANDYTLADLEARGFDPLAFRYLCMTVRYRTRLNFTFSALKAAQRALLRLRNLVWQWWNLPSLEGYGEEAESWRQRFWEMVFDDLNLPGALALTQGLLRSPLPAQVKLKLLLEFDHVFGLSLDQVPQEYQVETAVRQELDRRQQLRAQARYQEADAVRQRLLQDKYIVHDARDRVLARLKSSFERHEEAWPTISSSKEVADWVDEPDAVNVSVNLVVCNYQEDVQRCLGAVLEAAQGHSMEAVVVDNGSEDGTGRWLEGLAREDPRVRVLHTDHNLGEAPAKNIALKQSRGRIIVQLDPSVEVVGDLFTPLNQVLAEASVGVVGGHGLCTEDLRHFHDAESGDVDAMQAYCFAFRRQTLKDVGLMRENFRFYRNLDLEFSFRFKYRGYRIVSLAGLPLLLHEHRVWTALSEEEQEKLSRDNFRKFLHEWGHHRDLLVVSQRRD